MEPVMENPIEKQRQGHGAKVIKALIAAYAVIGIAKGCAVFYKFDPIIYEFRQVARSIYDGHCEDIISCGPYSGEQLEELVWQYDAKVHSHGCWEIGMWWETRVPVVCYNPIPSLELFSRAPKSF